MQKGRIVKPNTAATNTSAAPSIPGTQKTRMVYVGDFPVDTGFGVVSQNLLAEWDASFDINVLGVNYYGDYNPLIHKFKTWPAHNGGEDVYGITKLPQMLARIKPDVCFILNDPWVTAQYVPNLLKYRNEYPLTRFFTYGPVDAPNIKSIYVAPLNDLFERVFTYTDFAARELVAAGLTVPVTVLPHGMRLDTFRPINKAVVRSQMHIPPDSFVVLNNNRNQPRKRIDLTIAYFAEWVRRYDLPPSVRLYYHGALKDVGYDIVQLCEYYGIKDRLILTSPHLTPESLLPVEHLNMVYNAADVFLTTTMAEGWSLTVMEALATKLPAIVPEHSALAEWARGGVEYVPAPEIYVSPGGLNTIHYVPDREATIAALHKLYTDAGKRKALGEAGLQLVQQDKYRWENIAREFARYIQGKPHGIAIK